MAETVNIELPGEINAPSKDSKRAFQKYVNELETVFEHIKGGAGPLLITFLSTRKPWTQFAATDRFKPPTSLPKLTRRFYRNIEHFQGNYLVVFLGLFAYCLITNPILLFALVGSFFLYRKITSGPNNFKVFGYELSKTQKYAVAIAGSMFIGWLADAGAVLFWVLGATMTVVALHASFYDTELLTDSEDPEQFPMIEQV